MCAGATIKPSLSLPLSLQTKQIEAMTAGNVVSDVLTRERKTEQQMKVDAGLLGLDAHGHSGASADRQTLGHTGPC